MSNPFAQFKQPDNGGTAGGGGDNPFAQFAPKPAFQRPAPPVQTEPRDRTGGEIATDTLTGVAQGAVNLVGGIASLGEAVGPVNLVRHAARAAGVDLGVPTTYAAEATQKASDWLGDRLSQPMQQRRERLQRAEGFLESAKTVLTDPALAGQFAAEQVANIIPAAALARGASAAGRAAALARGATPAAAAQAGTRSAVTAMTGASAVQGAGAANQQTIVEALRAPDEVWAANEEYQRLVADGMASEDAKRTIAAQAGAIAAPVAGVISGLAGRVAAPFEADLFTRNLPVSGVGALFTREGALQVAGGVGRESLEEGVQEGGEQFAANLGLQQVDPTRSLAEGVPEAAGTGAALGGIIGGGLAVAGTATQGADGRQLDDESEAGGGEPGAAPAPAPVLPPSPTTEAALRIQAETAPTPAARESARSQLAAMLESQGRMIPGPGQTPINVTPEGEARTAAQELGIAQQRAGELQQQAEVGLTPDVLAAQQRDPRTPALRFPDARPNSLSDAANVLPGAAPNLTPVTGRAADSAPVPGTAEAAPAVPPGVDPQTGEVRPEQGEEAARRAILQQLEMGRVPEPHMIAGATGITPRRAGELKSEIARQRKAEALAPKAAAEGRAAPAAATEQPTPPSSAAMPERAQNEDAVAGSTAAVEAAPVRSPGIPDAPAAVDETPDAAPVTDETDAGTEVTPATAAVEAPDLPAEADAAAGAVEAVASPETRAVEASDAGAAAPAPADDVRSRVNAAFVAAYNQARPDRAITEADLGERSMAAELARGIEARDADAIIGMNLGDAGSNPALRAAFEAATGVKLPKGRGATERAIDEWAGVTPEQRAERVQSRKDRLEQQRQESEDKAVEARATRTRMKIDGEEKSVKEAVDGIIAAGFTRLDTIKRGAVTKTVLANAEGRAYTLPSASGVAEYAKLAARRIATESPAQAAEREGAAARTAVEQREAELGLIDAQLAMNRARITELKLKKGDVVTYLSGTTLREGTVSKIEADQGILTIGNEFVPARRVSFKGRRDAPETTDAPAESEAPVASTGDSQPDADTDAAPVAAAAAEAATSPTNDLPAPTEAQKEAGNYKKGHVVLNGLDISIENPAGSKRREEWPPLAHHYGYIKRTEGADGDHVDVFMSDDAGNPDLPVFVVDQRNRDGSFDEAKVMLGFADEAAARAGYLANYTKGWNGLGAISSMTLDEFKTWLRDGDTTKPVAYEAPATEPLAAAATAPTAVAAAPGELRPKVRVRGGKPEYVEGHPDTLAAYFAPGRVVKAYGGLDRVLEFRPAAENTPWAVRVVRVDDNGEPVKGERERWHGTQPETRELVKVFGKPVAPQKGKAAAAEKPAAQPAAEIDDFGETLLGARKHLAGEYAKRLEDAATLDLAAEPLSRTWPEPEYQKLLDNGADPFVVSFVRAMRDEIPRKPVAKWKINGWATKVRELREFASALLADGELGKKLTANLTSPEYAGKLGEVKGRAELYQEVGHGRSLQGVRFGRHHYAVYRGEKDVTRWTVEKDRAASAYSNWPHELAVGKTREEALDAFRAFLAKEAAAEAQAGAEATGAKMPRFDIYSRRRGEGFIIGVRLRGGDALDLRRFTDVKEARAFLADDANKAVLAEEVRKLRDVPSVRGDLNAPRVGVDHRSGADVSPEQFGEAFGFRGVQFGNYVEGPRRQQDLNNAYDALMDLAGVIGIPPRALSLNGTLGLAFGARGQGGKNPAMAHFEPGTIVINLTKGKGAGSLAHEWFHGLDNYFARQRGAPVGFATVEAKAGDAHRDVPMRTEMRAAFLRLVKAISDTGVKARSDALDKLRSKAYWGTREEMAARAFESYVIAKLGEGGASNDYLANVVPEAAFSREGEYPYPTAAELPTIRAGFDDFFGTIEAREGEGGAVALFSQPERRARTDGRGQRSIDFAGATFVERSGTYLLADDAGQPRDFFRVADAEAEASRLGAEVLQDDPTDGRRTWSVRLPAREQAAAERELLDEPADALFSAQIAAFADQVRERLAAGDRRGASLTMGRTPAVLRMVGAPDLPMTMPPGVLFKLATGKDGARAPLTSRQIERLPEALDEAIAVFDSATVPGAYVVLTNLADSEGSPIIAAVEVSGSDRSPRGAQSEVVVNVLTSAYGKGRAQAWVDEQVAAGRLRFHNDEGPAARGPGRELNFPTGALAQDPTTESVLRTADLRNFRAASRAQLSEGDGRAAGVDAAALDTAVRAVTAKWEGDAPPVSVRATPADLPEDLRDKPDASTAEGVYYRGRVYLIASNLKDVARAMQVLAHEAFGHYGVEAVVGAREWAAIVRDIAVYRKHREKLSDAMKAVYESADRRYTKSDPVEYAKEVLAIMAELDVKETSGLNRVLAAVRRFLRRLGLVDQLNESDLRNIVSRGMRHVERGGPAVRQSVGDALPAAMSQSLGELSRAFDKLAKLDGIFRYPTSAKTDLRGLLADYLPAADMRVVFERDAAVPVSEDEVAPARGYVIEMGEDGGDATVYIEHGEQRRIVLDASNLKAGKAKGSALYMALFNYALNTDRIFIGDPSGLTDVALLRRTELMAAAAIKYRTTRMMAPHPRQIRPDVKWATPLRWTPGNDGANMESLLRTSYQNTLSFAPEIADGSFDFALQDFRGAGGRPLTRDGLERIASGARKAFAGRPRQQGADKPGEEAFGRATIARALLANTVVRGAGEARAELVDGPERGAGRGAGGVAPASLQGILYSQPGPDAAKPGEPLFSQPDPQAIDDAIGDAMKDPPLTDRIRQAFDDATKGGGIESKARQALLYGVTLRHIAELGGKLLPSLQNYVDTVQQMATDRNTMQEDAGNIATEWEKLQRKDRRGADATANLMHDATIDGVDPDAEYQPLTFATFETVTEDGKATERRVERPVNRRNVEAEVQALKRRRRTADESTKAKLTERIEQLEERLAKEQARAAAYPVLLARWQALPEAWKKLYRDAREAYTAQSARYEDALVKRIEDLIEEGATRASYVAQIRQQFEAQRLEGPYFPLARFGDFWISAKTPAGEPAFFMYEKIGEWRRAQADLKSRGYTIRAASEKFETVNAANGPSSGFMADLMDTLGKAGVTDDAKDAVYQLYLRSLPDLSIRKSFIHRKKTAGYSQDALRAFAGNLFHGSFQIARLRHSHNLELAMRAMREQEKEYAKTDPDKAQQAAQIIREMTHRHEWVMNPKDSAVTSTLTSLGFVWYLGVSPAAALINLTQTAIVTFPVLASKFGAAKASTALLEGMRRAISSVNGDITRGLDDEERRAFKVWYESGAIDKSLAHGLAGLSETDTAQLNPVYRRTMEIVSWLFHKAEVVNREASALAAFRLARDSGMGFDEATQYAGKAVWESHFDYQNQNRARWMQGNVAKVIFLFRQYSLNMSWFLWRNAYQALEGESPEVKRDARRKLTGVLGMTSLFSGVLGLPLVSVTMGVANAAAAAFGDDEEPWDAEIAFRNFLADYLGPEAGRLVTGGAVEAATGLEISSRTSLNDLWIREPDRQLEGEAMGNYILQTLAGPVGGIGFGFLRGAQLLEEGHPWRAMEAMVPKFIRDALRSMRFAEEGVTTLRGDPIIEELTLGETLAQISGFGPSRLADQYAANSAIKGYEERLLKKRQRLLNAFATAAQAGDEDSMRETLARIRRWNSEVPQLAVDRDTIYRSLRQRARYSGRAVAGTVVDRRIEAQAREQARFAESTGT